LPILLDEDSIDFVIVASEFNGAGFDRICEFHAREAFLRRAIPPVRLSPGLLLDEEEFRVSVRCARARQTIARFAFTTV
jgi:ribonuclease Z